MTTYAYNELNTQRREIRLCTLLPGSFGEPVACSLSAVSLDDKPEYESLSYVWGAPIFNKELVVRDNVERGSRARNPDSGTTAASPPDPDLILRVTTNLHTAFQYLRKSDQNRVLWADAVCINQNDIDERSSQVSIMSDIYKDARNCQVWLGTVEEIKYSPDEAPKLDIVMQEDFSNFGEFLHSQGILTDLPQLSSAGKATISPDESVLGALEILLHLLQNKHLYQMPFWRHREIPANNVYFVGTWYKCLQTLVSIVSHPWWERVWVVQEAVLSPNAILNIGRYRVLLACFFPAARNYRTHTENCCQIWTRLWHGLSEQISLPMPTKMRLVKDLGGVIDAHATNKLVPISIASLSRERKATDARDHFYAITGLMKNPFNGAPLGPMPDYRKDPRLLFTEQTLSLMQQSVSISLLDQAIGVDAPNPHGLPSWACDWSRFTRMGWRSSLYNASGGHEHQFQPAADDGTLTIAGAPLGVVSTLGNPVDPNDADDIRVKVEQWQHLTGTDQTFDIRTVLRTTFMDMVMTGQGEHRRLTACDMALVEEWWWQWIVRMKRSPTPLESPELWVTNSCFSYQMKRDRAFATREGHFGVGPRTVCVGDEIFIVRGAKVPLVLRAIDDGSLGASSSGRGRDYLYVGRCYLHGCMDGEAVTPEINWQTLHLL